MAGSRGREGNEVPSICKIRAHMFQGLILHPPPLPPGTLGAKLCVLCLS